MKINQYSVGKEHLYNFYRFIILPWELEWVNQAFHISEGNLRDFCRKNNINIKSFESSRKLSEAISSEYDSQEKQLTGILWFVRKETKPKDTLRHLRNCFAHGNFKKRQRNKAPCVVIENIDSGHVKAKGLLPLEKLSELVSSASSCSVLMSKK